MYKKLCGNYWHHDMHLLEDGDSFKKCIRCGLRSNKGPVEVRFWWSVNKNGPIPCNSPHLGSCWLWTGRINKDGYGLFSFVESGKCVTKRAHQYSWKISGKEIPKFSDGFTLDHICKIKKCVRDSHLQVMTNSENARNGNLKEYCLRGHIQTPENRYTEPKSGESRCYLCIVDLREASRLYYYIHKLSLKS